MAPLTILLESLALATGESVTSAEAAALLERVDALEVPGLAAQAAALLTLGGHPATARLAKIVRRSADRLPAELHGERRETLSIIEALDITRGH